MILVFGQNGQVATELRAFEGVKALGRQQVDLSDPQASASVILSHKPSVVINAAAYTFVDKAEEDIELANIINGEAPGAMALACSKLGIPLVQLSTDYVFDGTGMRPWSENDIPNPKNVYGSSKFKGEQAIKSAGCTYAILRTSWIVSAHGNNFVKTMLSLSEMRDCLTVVNDQVGGPTCARDIAETCISIAKQLIADPKKSGIYHYSGQPDVSWCDFANAIFEYKGRKTIARPIKSSDYPTPAMRPANSKLDCSTTLENKIIP